jgi:peptidyl-prolyl cis-trans isomerase B (cyclophilin B)
MTSKRERELARAKYERQTERRTERQNRERFIKMAVAVGVIFVIAFGIPALKNASKTTSSPTESTPTASTPTSLPICKEVGPNRPDTMKFAKVPASATSGSALTLRTNCGNVEIALDKRAPKTTAAMSFLAERGFFNQTQCHRLTTQGIYVLQCGDPTATGSGGPGFSFKDENFPAATGGSAVYKRGTVAMANSGPNTNGSQFFLVFKDSPLPPNYSVWGKITSGLDILDQIAGAGVAGGGADGSPNQRVVIAKASVTP